MMLVLYGQITQPSSTDIWAQFVQYGILGVLVFLLGVLAWSFIKREREEKIFWRDSYLELSGKVTDKYVPSLEANTESNKQVLLFLHDLGRDIENWRRP